MHGFPDPVSIQVQPDGGLNDTASIEGDQVEIIGVQGPRLRIGVIQYSLAFLQVSA